MKNNIPWLRLRFWHRWLGLLCLLPLLIAALSGTLLVYKKPLVQLLVAGSAALPVDYSPADIAAQVDRLIAIVRPYDVDRLTAPNPQEPFWTVTLRDGSVKLYALSDLQEYRNNLWFLQVVSFIHHLHTELLSGTTGQTVLLISGMGAVVMTLSGVWLWWPGRKGFRWRYVRPWSLKLQSILQWHRHGGIVVALPLMIVVFSGALMLWQKRVAPVVKPPPAIMISANPAQLELSRDGLLSASQALAMAQQQLPDGWPVFIRYPRSLETAGQTVGQASSDYRFRFRLAGEWHPNGRTNITVNGQNGAISMTSRADTLPWQNRLVNQLYPFHSSYGLHWLYAPGVLLAGIGMLCLGISGLISYWRRRQRV